MQRPLVLVALLALPSSALAAQSAFEELLAVTVFAGLTTGTDLWAVPNQPVGLINSDLTTVGKDTFALARRAGDGIVVGMAATLFRSAHFGIGAEVSYTGPTEHNECSVVFRGTPSPGSGEARGYNDDLCRAIDAEEGVLGSISLLADLWLRTGKSDRVATFVRFGAGVTDLGRSSAEMSGRFVGPDVTGDGVGDVIDRPIMLDQQTPTVGFTCGAGVGLLVPVPGGHSLRFEARDQVFLRAVATGPADALSLARAERRWFHSPAIVVGFGIRMERRRGRVRPGP